MVNQSHRPLTYLFDWVKLMSAMGIIATSAMGAKETLDRVKITKVF